ncbi:Signal transduction histidine kinase [Rhodospirillaceae bacterium LM-1]|nr:Signal transduction histidine kinase [Rhodospirillaceae bacterium LM-1]
MDASVPKSRQELQAELACLKARLREYEAKERVERETGDAFLRTLSGIDHCQDRLKAKDSELCEAQRCLELALWRYASLFNNSPIGYLLIDEKGFLREVNAKGAALLSSPPEPLHGMPLEAFIEPEFRPGFGRHLSQIFQGFGGQIELTLKAPDTLPMPVILQSSLMEDARSGLGPMCLSAVLDISSRKEAERILALRTEELARSNEDLERFAYVISHDLQEPLRNIGNYVQMLARRYKGRLDDDADTFIGFVTDGVARLSSMIRDLLSFSRITTQCQAPEPVDSGAALLDALANLESAIQESSAEICIETMPGVIADRMQLVSLFQNLLGNALKYRTPAKKPMIRIATRRVGKRWLFSITDNGVGIEHHQFERLFTLFQRIDPHGHVPGSGIGLAVCKRIVERHGGEIWVESTPGQGSAFYFTLEAAQI